MTHRKISRIYGRKYPTFGVKRKRTRKLAWTDCHSRKVVLLLFSRYGISFYISFHIICFSVSQTRPCPWTPFLMSPESSSFYTELRDYVQFLCTCTRDVRMYIVELHVCVLQTRGNSFTGWRISKTPKLKIENHLELTTNNYLRAKCQSSYSNKVNSAEVKTLNSQYLICLREYRYWNRQEHHQHWRHSYGHQKLNSGIFLALTFWIH